MPKKYCQGVYFCLTLNNYAEDDCEKLRSIDWIKYAVVGREVGESGTKHLQAYIQVTREKKTTESGMAKKLLKEGLSSKPHVEISKGTPEEASEYCKKDGDYEEWGEMSVGKGSRRDIKRFLSAAADGMRDCELAAEYPTEFAKYHKAAEKARRDKKAAEGEKRMRAIYKGAELRDWQEDVVKTVDQQNDRKVLWVVDEKGGKGKSWLGNWLLANKDAFLIEGGKVADIAHAFNCQKWVAIDLTRAQAEKTEYIYSVIESFKNGRIFSPKYDSAMKLFEPCKVVVFANWYPDKEKLSEDRWQIKDLGEKNPWSIARKAPEEDAPDDFKISDEFWFAAED